MSDEVQMNDEMGEEMPAAMEGEEMPAAMPAMDADGEDAEMAPEEEAAA